MLKTSGLILTAGMILGGAGFAVGQEVPPEGLPSGQLLVAMPSGQLPPEAAEILNAQERLILEACPELHVFQERLNTIKAEIAEIIKRFTKKQITKNQARAELLPLVAEELEIRNSPAFLVEQKLLQVYLSSPEYQAKIKKIINRVKAQRKSVK